MVKKCDICSLADPLVIDHIPDSTRTVIDQNLEAYENIKALVKGMNNETLVVTDRGVYVIKAKDRCFFFSYDDILPGQKIFRVYRRGRFELTVKGKERGRLTDPEKKPDFEPDPADNVVNFPWSKMALFQKVEEIIDINKQKYDTGSSGHAENSEADTACVDDMVDELARLKRKVTDLEKALSSAQK